MDAEPSAPAREPAGPAYIACCRIWDPDPACVRVQRFTIGWCPMCEEAIMISPESMLIIFDTDAVPICIQCAVKIPGLVFARA